MNIFNATRLKKKLTKNKCLIISHQRTTMPTPTRRTLVSFVSDPKSARFSCEILRSAEELFAWAARRLRLVAVGDRTVAAVAFDRWCVFSSCLLSHISRIACDLCVITGSSDKIRRAFFPRCFWLALQTYHAEQSPVFANFCTHLASVKRSSRRSQSHCSTHYHRFFWWILLGDFSVLILRECMLVFSWAQFAC